MRRIYDCDERARNNYDAPGRWPANMILSHTKHCQQVGRTHIQASGHHPATRSNTGELVGSWKCSPDCAVRALDAQSNQVSRFFYCAKASPSERNAGTEGLPTSLIGTYGGKENDLPASKKPTRPRANTHPTVKPITLMRHLVRLVTPPGGIVLDPFTGSGSTGIAAVMEGARFIGMELDPDYIKIARARIKHWAGQASEPERLS